MGNDGGSIPDRRDLVKNKPKAEQRDEKTVLKAIWFFCALSKKPLTMPVVADPLGKLFNKDSVIEFLLDRNSFGDGDQICGYLKGVKDLLNLTLTPNPAFTAPTSSTTLNTDTPPRAPFICPLTLKEMSGTLPFVAIRSCGCVFSEAGIKSIITSAASGSPKEGEKEKEERELPCPNCSRPFKPAGEAGKGPWLILNPKANIQERLLEELLEERAAAKLKTKSAKSDSKKRKSNALDSSVPTPSLSLESSDLSTKRIKTNAPTPTIAPASHLSSKMQAELAALEQRRKEAGRSRAVQSIYAGKEESGKKGSGNDFFTRTFTRYA